MTIEHFRQHLKENKKILLNNAHNHRFEQTGYMYFVLGKEYDVILDDMDYYLNLKDEKK